jgi:hypothetical protein
MELTIGNVFTGESMSAINRGNHVPQAGEDSSLAINAQEDMFTRRHNLLHVKEAGHRSAAGDAGWAKHDGLAA